MKSAIECFGDLKEKDKLTIDVKQFREKRSSDVTDFLAVVLDVSRKSKTQKRIYILRQSEK